jgi:DNA polymerase-3 subunit delta
VLADHQLAHLLDAASICDGIVKGLKHPEWPLEPWPALRRLALMAIEAQRPAPLKGGVRRVLALQ